MLDAGYFMPKKAFFNNIGAVLTYAVIGTMFNAFAIGFTLYGAYKAGAFPGIDDGLPKTLGLLDKAKNIVFTERYSQCSNFAYFNRKIKPRLAAYFRMGRFQKVHINNEFATQYT